jgi:ABC-2 type transport system permease protein
MTRHVLRTIIAKELHDIRHDMRIRWASPALYVLFALALFSGGRYYTETQPRHETAQAVSYQQWLAQGTKNPHSAAHYGFYAYKPVPLMSIVDKGMDEYLGNAVWMEAHKQNNVGNRTAHDMADVSRFGSLTVGFVLQSLLPLVIILLTFNAVSKERESGTLRMILGTHVSGVQLLAGKGFAVLIAVVVVMLIPMLLLSLAVMLVSNGSAFASVLPTFAVWSCVMLVSAVVWILAGLVVSASLRESGGALLLLLVFWTIGAFFIPRISGSVTKMLYPTPSAFAFNETIIQEKAKGVDGHNPADQRGKELEARVLKQYGVDSLSQLPVSFAGISLQSGEEHDYIVFDKNYSSLFQTFQQQETLLEAIHVLSPILATQSLSRALAGTDTDKHLHFTNNAEQFRRVIMKTMNADMTENGAKDKVKRDFAYMTDENLWKRVPPYTYTAPDMGFALRNQSLSIISLLGWVALLCGLLVWRGKSLKP